MAEKIAPPPAPADAPWEPRKISLIAHLTLLLGAAAAVFFSGSAQQGSLGAVLVAAGAALLLCPPQMRVNGRICALAAGLVIAAALALLPQRWFPEPAWRQRLIAAGIALPATVTPMVRETCFWIAVLAVAATVAIFALAHPLRSTAQLAVAVVAVVICAVYAGLARYADVSGWEYPFDYDPGVFGFFKNINHTSSFLVTGSVVSLGILGVAFRGRHWVAGSLAAASLAVCVTSIFFFTSSRAGVLSLIFGVLLWFIGVGLQHRSKPLLVSFAAVFAASVLLFLASESKARNRLLTLFGINAGTSSSLQAHPGPIDPDPSRTATPSWDLRALIYADTLQIIRAYPFTGTGLGTFPYVFPLYRDLSLNGAPSVHPESDWLMLAAEAGLPAVLLFAAGVGLLLRRVWPWRKHRYWPLRWGLLCAALAALIHGCVDVPSHFLGWWILAIAGAGFQTHPQVPSRPSRWDHGVFLLAGLGTIVFGVLLIRGQWFGGFSLPPFEPTMAAVDVYIKHDNGEPNEAVKIGREGILKYPMARFLYRPLGITLLEMPGRVAEAASILRAERLLDAGLVSIPVDQGELWLSRDLAKTAALWQEALQLQRRIDRVQRNAGAGARGLYSELLHRAAKYPSLQLELFAATDENPEFILIWLENSASAVVPQEIARFADNSALLSEFSETQRRRFLTAWYKNGDRGRLFELIEQGSGWKDSAWPIYLRRMVDLGQFKEASEAVAKRYDLDIALPTPGSSETEAGNSEINTDREAFLAAWARGNTIAARRILEEARSKPKPPAEVWRLSAALAAFEEKWPSAWEYLKRYVAESDQDLLR